MRVWKIFHESNDTETADGDYQDNRILSINPETISQRGSAEASHVYGERGQDSNLRPMPLKEYPTHVAGVSKMHHKLRDSRGLLVGLLSTECFCTVLPIRVYSLKCWLVCGDFCGGMRKPSRLRH